MRYRLMLCALLLCAVPFAAHGQALCVKCSDGACVSWDSGFVNCGSMGGNCRQWTSCGSGGGLGCDAGVPGDDCENGLLLRTAQWQLARVEVHPAPRVRPEWRLASVSVIAASRTQ